MKIEFLQQNIKNQDALQKGLLDLQNDLASVKIPLGYSLKPTTTVFTTQPFSNAAIGNAAEVVPEEILAEVSGASDIAFLIFSNENMNPKPLNPVCNYERKLNDVPCQMCEQWYNDYDNVFEAYVEHELCHAYSYKANKTDITHLLTDGTLQAQMPALYKYFSTKQTKDWYIYLLNALINVPSEAALPADDPSYLFNTATGQLNPNYKQFMQIEQSTLTLIEQFEGLSLVPYQDQGGVWTIGYGETQDPTGNPVTAATPALTQEQAQASLTEELQKYAAAVTNTIKVSLTQNQFDACVSLCYNIGVNGFEESTVARECNANNFPLAAQAFLLWDKVKGVVSDGLLNRRKVESELFLKS